MSDSKQKRRQLEKTAYHEAGHAVVAYLLGRSVRLVTIVPSEDGTLLGHVLYVPPRLKDEYQYWGSPSLKRAAFENIVRISLAGSIAEGRMAGRQSHRQASSDYRYAVEVVSGLVGDDRELSAYLNWLWISTENLLSVKPHWRAVEALAQKLLELRTIKGKDAKEIIRNALISPTRGTGGI